MQHLTLLGTLFTFLFILQTGLVPYNFSSENGTGVLFGAEVNRLTSADVILNIVLYLPFGYLLHTMLRRRMRLAALIVMASAFACSAGIEYAQFYLPARVSSRIDIVANVSGAGIGVALSAAFGWLLPQFFGALLYELRGRPGLVLVQTYLLFMVVAAAIPFSLTFDMQRLKAAARNANLTPFAAARAGFGFMDEQTLQRSSMTSQYQRWANLKNYSSWIAECVTFAVLIAMLFILFRWEYDFSGAVATILAAWMTIMLATGFSAAQFFIMTRGFDVTDVLCRLAGGFIGLAVLALYLRVWRGNLENWLDDHWYALVRCGVILIAAYITYNGVIPVAFDTNPQQALASLGSWNIVPFFGYQQSRLDVMVDDVVEKVFVFSVWAVFLSLWIDGRKHARGQASTRTENNSRALPLVLGTCVSLAMLVEIFQLTMQVRVTSLTDPVLAVVGGVVGHAFYDQAIRFYQYAHQYEMYGPEADQEEHHLSPLDELVASLTEPRPDAPREPKPTRRPIRRG